MGRSGRMQWPWFVAVLAGGVALSFFGAVVPHYSGAYRLDALLLVTGATPYVMFGFLAYLLHRSFLAGIGMGLLILHALLLVWQRWLTDGYLDGPLLYWVPLCAAAVLCGLWPAALRDADARARAPEQD
ncbi:hypothetical protein ABC977_14015 [Thioalkalicoccus limnaeus]|uniref:Uncharacterized protein n=1 Tax=Thioalkalicoccus limnaeus TaxID=120681 RepID=A0ABV4BG57_9GAMM